LCGKRLKVMILQALVELNFEVELTALVFR
jgi:hypothetical protein